MLFLEGEDVLFSKKIYFRKELKMLKDSELTQKTERNCDPIN